MLSAAALGWVDGVLSEARYKEVQGARDPFTHSRLSRNFIPAASRTEFVVSATGSTFSARDLVILAKDLATDQVVAFLDVIDGL